NPQACFGCSSPALRLGFCLRCGCAGGTLPLMAPSQDELEALKTKVAQLTARIYKLEQQAGLAAEFPQQKPIPDADVPQKPVPFVEEIAPKIQDKTPAAKTVSPLPPLPSIPQWKPATLAASKKDAESTLEKTIGQYW